MNSEQLIDYFNEHIIYEFDMLRGTSEEIRNSKNTKIIQNALFESYGVHARNLRDFLRNKKGKGKNTILASMYIKDYKAKQASDLSGSFQRLNSGLYHLGDDRSDNNESKFNSNDVKKTLAWIEREFCRFLKELPDIYKSKISPISDKNTLSDLVMIADSTEPSATNAVQSTTTKFLKTGEQ